MHSAQWAYTCDATPLPLHVDVDNMRSKAGTNATDKASFERLIDGIEVMVAILTGSVRRGEEYSDYFMSTPCLHELNRARENGMPVVFILESAPVTSIRSCNEGNLILPSISRDRMLPSAESCTPSLAQPTRYTAPSRSKRTG